MNTTPVLASEDEATSDSDIHKYVISTDHGDMIEGEISPLWFAHGHHYVYPNEGGVWDYGFWMAKVRSYYTVNRCHGSTVKVDNREHKSIDTAPDYPSIVELYAGDVGGVDRYYYRVC